MTKQESLIKWISNRQRKYADGLALFNELAPKQTKERYGPYFNQVKNEPAQFDPHFTMLINKLCDLERKIRQSPQMYPAALEETLTEAVKPLSTEEQKKELDNRQETVQVLTREIKELNENISELESDGEDKENEINELESKLEEKENELSKLQEEIKLLQKPGVKIVTEANLPAKQQKAYARIKEITPLYASLHNDIANPSTKDADRKSLADQLCKLDDERRKLWKEIDDWAEGKEVQLDEQRPQFSDNEVVRGYEIARQIKRLQQNITNTKGTITRATNEGKETIRQNAVNRLAKYEAELAELQKEVAGEKVSG